MSEEVELGKVYTEDECRGLVKSLASSGRLTQTFGFTVDKYPYFRTGEYHFFGTKSILDNTVGGELTYQLISIPGEKLEKESDFEIFVPKAKGDRSANYYKRYNLNKVSSVVDRPEFDTAGRQTMSKADEKRFRGLSH